MKKIYVTPASLVVALHTESLMTVGSANDETGTAKNSSGDVLWYTDDRDFDNDWDDIEE